MGAINGILMGVYAVVNIIDLKINAKYMFKTVCMA